MSVALPHPHRPVATTPAARSPLGTERRLQLALGLIWLADGALQLQPFMFTRSFVTQIVAPNTAGQPLFVGWPIRVAEHLIEPRVALFNAFAAALQILIGLGLLYRPTVKAALLGSIGWALTVWWMGEGLGGLFTGAASPLTGAPGAALLYVVASLFLWPGSRPRATLVAWLTLWLGSAALWLLPANRAADAVHDQIANAPAGAPWLSHIEASLAAASEGHGLTIAVVAALISAAIGVGAFADRWAMELRWVSPSRSPSSTSSRARASAASSRAPEPTPAPARFSSCWHSRSP